MSNAVWGVFVFTGSWLAAPFPSTDHRLISRIIKEGGNIDAELRNDYSPSLQCSQGGSDTRL